MTRSEFLAEVAKAANKARKRRQPRVMAEASLDALAGAREADPMRGVRAARLVPRCGKVKTTDRRPCKSPCVRGGTRCWRHGGLRQTPSHPGNIRRLLGGVYAYHDAYRLERYGRATKTAPDQRVIHRGNASREAARRRRESSTETR